MKKEKRDEIQDKALELFPVAEVGEFKTSPSFDLNSKMRNAYFLGYSDCYNNEKEIISRIDEMCIESLDPKIYEQWDNIRQQLVNVRPLLRP